MKVEVPFQAGGAALSHPQIQLAADCFVQVDIEEAGQDRSADDDIGKLRHNVVKGCRAPGVPGEAAKLLDSLAGLLSE